MSIAQRRKTDDREGWCQHRQRAPGPTLLYQYKLATNSVAAP